MRDKKRKRERENNEIKKKEKKTNFVVFLRRWCGNFGKDAAEEF